MQISTSVGVVQAMTFLCACLTGVIQLRPGYHKHKSGSRAAQDKKIEQTRRLNEEIETGRFEAGGFGSKKRSARCRTWLYMQVVVGGLQGGMTKEE
jgi:hypothetical protein